MLVTVTMHQQATVTVIAETLIVTQLPTVHQLTVQTVTHKSGYNPVIVN
jgi:hypothetical protein